MPADPGPALPDPDEFDRMLRELTSGRAEPARFQELSAEERAKRAAGPPAPRRPGWRGARKAKKVKRPAPEPRRDNLVPHRSVRGRPFSPGSAGSPSQPRGQHHRVRSFAKVTGVLAAFCVLLYVLHTLGFGPQASTSSGTPASHPSSSPSAHRPAGGAAPAFTVADPFAHSRAEQYPSGAAGITVPVAHSIKDYTAAQVASAYAITRRLLIAAELDQATLDGRSPNALSRLLTPVQRSEFVRGLARKGTDKQGSPLSTRTWVTSFAPGTEFVGTVIKVFGYMKAQATSYAGRHVLRVTFNYLFVYPVQRPNRPATRMRIVAHVRGSANFARWDRAIGALQAWWLPSGGGTAGAVCGVTDGFVHPAFPGRPPGKVHPSGKAIDPYGLYTQPVQGQCERTTGT